MSYWWVNQNQTYEHEIRGGYLWSPQRSRSGGFIQFYENMRSVKPGDIVISFCDKAFAAVGVATSRCYESPQPSEFMDLGLWNNVGWRVDVTFHEISNPIRPKDHMDIIRPLLADKYAPIGADGKGMQVYLAAISDTLGNVLMGLIQTKEKIPLHNIQLMAMATEQFDQKEKIEEEKEASILKDANLPETQRAALIQARQGQGIFRHNVIILEKSCRVTKVQAPQYLRASHIKPWKDSNNQERLDAENGLLLAPHVDFLFDRGLITFSDNTVAISKQVPVDVLTRFGLGEMKTANVGTFSRKQSQYLEFHQNEVFKG